MSSHWKSLCPKWSKSTMRRSLLIGLILLMMVPFALAQEPLTLSTEQGTLSLEIPEGWESNVEDNYAIATNRGVDDSTRTDVQMVITPVDALNSVLPEPIDMEVDNPALDYLEKYAASSDRGVYSEPIEIEIGETPASLMLYIEKPDS